MKFIAQGEISPQRSEDSSCDNYYDLNNLPTKVQCQSCKKDISNCHKILSQQKDYCCVCFANLSEYHDYNIISTYDFPIYHQNWTAYEEIALLTAIQQCGYDNWQEIAQEMGTEKSKQEIQDHYMTLFMHNQTFIPVIAPIARRDSQGKIAINTNNNHFKRPVSSFSKNKHQKHTQTSDTRRPQIKNGVKSASNPAQIVGYMPKRFQFQVQYDNDAQLLLAEMEFNDDDSKQEMKMNFRIIEIYNMRLTERIRRKQFVISRNLLDPKQQKRINQHRTKGEKEIYQMMRIFARYNSPEDHQALVSGIIEEKDIRHRIRYLTEMKQKGYRSLAQAQNAQKKMSETKTIQISQKSSRHKKSKAVQQQHLTKQQEQICGRFNLTSKQYLMFKETLMRECVKQGIIKKQNYSPNIKERNVIDAIFQIPLDCESNHE